MENVSLDKILIREFSPNDAQLVSDFFDQMGGETRAFFNRNDCNRKAVQSYFSGTVINTVHFLAEFEGKMVGYLFFWDINTRIPWIGIAVHEQFKGIKLGKKLMEFAIDYALKQNKGGILLTTHVANIRGQALYERFGFINMGQYKGSEFLYLLRF